MEAGQGGERRFSPPCPQAGNKGKAEGQLQAGRTGMEGP